MVVVTAVLVHYCFHSHDQVAWSVKSMWSCMNLLKAVFPPLPLCYWAIIRMSAHYFWRHPPHFPNNPYYIWNDFLKFVSLYLVYCTLTLMAMNLQLQQYLLVVSVYSTCSFSSWCIYRWFLMSPLDLIFLLHVGMDLHELLDIPQGDRRKYHDDVTVMVISLEGRIWKSSGKYLWNLQSMKFLSTGDNRRCTSEVAVAVWSPNRVRCLQAVWKSPNSDPLLMGRWGFFRLAS